MTRQPRLFDRLLLRLFGVRLPGLPVPGVVWGAAPQREGQHLRGAALGWTRTLSPGAASRGARRARQLARAMTHGAAGDCGRSGNDAALLRVARAIRQCTGLQPHRAQFEAAIAMLEDCVAELPTGEGKSLAMVLGACVRAASGVPVHLVTSNDALVERDARALRPVAQALGLRVGEVVQQSTQQDRHTAYRMDICVVTARELMFDDLRDRLMGLAGDPQRATLAGLCCALIDEADTALIDEAVVPCILALPTGQQHEAEHRSALALARGLRAGVDFVLEPGARRALLTRRGMQSVSLAWRQGAADETPMSLERHRNEAVERALGALHLYRRDRDYVVTGGKVQIVDGISARLADGRSWSDGLHQMIELIEGVAATERRRTALKITAQQFFGRYWRLGGISATVREVAPELRQVYGLGFRRVPPMNPSQCRTAPWLLCTDRAAQQRAVLQRVCEHTGAGRPVLVATASVADCESFAALIEGAGLRPQRLHAADAQGENERQLVAMAGRPGVITVTTPLLGRGTDIQVDAAVRAQGGLAIVATCLYRDGRIDRQLHGRTARHGAPGIVETVLDRRHPIAGIPEPSDRAHSPQRPHGPKMLRRGLRHAVLRWRVLELQRRLQRRDRGARRRLLERVRTEQQSSPWADTAMAHAAHAS